MKRLIVNADDFGLHPLINKAIYLGCKNGLIKSTSIMAGAAFFDEAAELAADCSDLGVGIHLTLVGGIQPVFKRQNSTLLTANGVFVDDYIQFAKRWYTGKIVKQEVVDELKAQIEYVLSKDLRVTHLDSHQHLHILPGISEMVLDLCSEYNIKKMRMPGESMLWSGGFTAKIARVVGRDGLSLCTALARYKADLAGIIYPQHFFGMLAGGHLNAALVAKIIASLPEGSTEIMTHPGLSSEKLAASFSWGYHWEDEYNAFV